MSDAEPTLPPAAESPAARPFENPVAFGAAPQPASGRNRLPWLLVAALAALSLVLGTLLVVKEGELQAIRATPAAAPSSSPAATGSASPDAEAVAVMKSLPRRIADDPTAMGQVDAPVIMIVWSDYRCPFCAKWATSTLKDLLPYVESGSLRIESRDLVLFGEESTLAAVAARAAGQQGKFWQFHDAVFAKAPASGHPTIKKADVLAFAKTAGVPDLKKFESDLASKALADAVAADTSQAQQLGISGTPFFLINTTPINGALPTATFVETIEGYGARK